VFQTIRNAFKIPDLRKKLLFTLFIILIFRVGASIPVPFMDLVKLGDGIKFGNGDLLGYLDILTGGAFSSGTLFAMSITPYINASIIMQLLTIAIPALERMNKEGEEGRKKIGQITRIVTVVIGLIQGFAYYTMLAWKYQLVVYNTGKSGIFAAVVIVFAFTAGTALMMWLGEQINDRGIGNGISILLFAGIVSRGPQIVSLLQKQFAIGGKNYFLVPLIVVVFVLIVAFIVVITNAERRIPVQYAKRVVGRKLMGGQSSFIPIKVNMTGVMPIIFASSFLALPGTIVNFADPDKSSKIAKIFGIFSTRSWVYALIYFILIIAFNFFYVTIQYNPVEIANNLRKNNGGIPGIRPGRPTSDFISRILSKITLTGAMFLGAIAIFPIFLEMFTGIPLSLGGTSILIVVGVALETSKQIESQMLMRHYKGFLE
jgi:preprotein translocase subunit SecY